MPKRIEVPESAVRTRDAILSDVTVRGGHAWIPCWNCGGGGTYPSSMIPAGMCRLYCWQQRTPDTYGKLAREVETYVKAQQAADRKAYRERVKWEAEAPAREAARIAREAIEAERAARAAEREAQRAAERAKSEHVGTVGTRATFRVIVEKILYFEGSGGYGWQGQGRYLLKMRDLGGNVLASWTSFPPFNGTVQEAEGQTFDIKATVKEHGAYNGERQTTVQRVTQVARIENATRT